MVVGGRDGSVKKIPSWGGIWRPTDRCEEDKLTSRSKEILRRMARRVLNSELQDTDEVSPSEMEAPLHNGVYASSTDY